MSEDKSVPCCGPGKTCHGSQPQVNRRDFLKSAAVAAGGVMAFETGASAAATASAPDFSKSPLDSPALREWRNSLWDKGAPRVYRGEALKHIGMPQGGFGAGQVYLSGVGGMGPWQIVNNFNSNAHAPGGFFGVWARAQGGATVARILQEGGLPGIAGVTAVEFTGEYPFAWLRYFDEILPVQVELEAYSPFIPLNTRDSSIPAVIFNFKISNPGAAPVEASLLASAPNLVGWDGYGVVNGVEHEDYIGNVNTLAALDGTTTLRFGTTLGSGHRLESPREIYLNDRGAAQLLRMCGNVSLTFSEELKAAKPGALATYWVGPLSRGGDAALKDALVQVAEGGGIVFAGSGDSLVAAGAGRDDAAEAEIFEDWSKGYGAWTIDGGCFGKEPAKGTLPNQQPVSGFYGDFLLNSYANGDGATGVARSKVFPIAKRYIHLQIGGGDYPGQTCVNLRFGNEVLATATGQNKEQLRNVAWDVSEHLGKTAQLEIVDQHTGGWGHVLVGAIAFSDSPAPPFIHPDVRALSKELLPFTWKSRAFVEEPATISDKSDLVDQQDEPQLVRGYWKLEGFRKKRGTKVLLATTERDPLVVMGRYGKGRIFVCLGPIERWLDPLARKRLAGRLAALAGETRYEPFTGWSEDSIHFGSMALSCDAPEASVAAQWDDQKSLWSDFSDDGRFNTDEYSTSASLAGRTWNGAMAAPFTLETGESRRISITLAWHFPNRTRDRRFWWGLGDIRYDHRLGNMYNNWYKDAVDVVRYAREHRGRLEADTRLFHTTFYESSSPRWYLDAISANMSIIRSPIYVWLEDGTVGGFEGTDACCPLNCTHVYNYAMSTAFLFPELERKIREIDLIAQMHPTEHYIPHRTIVPLSLPRLGKIIGGPNHPALDGELGTLLKTYREWRQHGDAIWFNNLWPRVKTHMEYICKEHDPEGTGVVRGEQPNTYDTHLYGSNTFIGTLYLAALRACQEMAAAQSDSSFAELCAARFEKGARGYDETCWNGEYYVNAYDAPNATPETYNKNNCYGPGCFSDQLFGQFWSHLLDLGPLLPPERTRQALDAIFRYNWRGDLSNHAHAQRVFAEGSEKGLLVGTWPKGGRPEHPILYCDEVWTGIEYQVATTMLYEGMVEEALAIVRAARERYTGDQRNPWSEIECGGHYARALSSYGLLQAAGGWAYHAGERAATIIPRLNPGEYMGFFTAALGWGLIEQDRFGRSQRNLIVLRWGELELDSLMIEMPASMGSLKPHFEVMLEDAPLTVYPAAESGGRYRLLFEQTMRVTAGRILSVQAQWA